METGRVWTEESWRDWYGVGDRSPTGEPFEFGAEEDFTHYLFGTSGSGLAGESVMFADFRVCTVWCSTL